MGTRFDWGHTERHDTTQSRARSPCTRPTTLRVPLLSETRPARTRDTVTARPASAQTSRCYWPGREIPRLTVSAAGGDAWYSDHSPGTPLRLRGPRSLKVRPEPTTRSCTVLDTSTSLGAA